MHWDVKMDLEEMGCESVVGIQLDWWETEWTVFVTVTLRRGSVKERVTYQLRKAPGSCLVMRCTCFCSQLILCLRLP